MCIAHTYVSSENLSRIVSILGACTCNPGTLELVHSMPRKKPFSGKQRKKQLQDQKKKRKDQNIG